MLPYVCVYLFYIYVWIRSRKSLVYSHGNRASVRVAAVLARVTRWHPAALAGNCCHRCLRQAVPSDSMGTTACARAPPAINLPLLSIKALVYFPN